MTRLAFKEFKFRGSNKQTKCRNNELKFGFSFAMKLKAHGKAIAFIKKFKTGIELAYFSSRVFELSSKSSLRLQNSGLDGRKTSWRISTAVVVVRLVHVVPVAYTAEVIILFFVLPERGTVMSNLVI